MIYSTEIIDKVCLLRCQGMSVPKIAHSLAREYPRYCKFSRKQENLASQDILKILEGLKAEGRLPSTLLDSLKMKVGKKGRSRPDVEKP